MHHVEVLDIDGFQNFRLHEGDEIILPGVHLEASPAPGDKVKLAFRDVDCVTKTREALITGSIDPGEPSNPREPVAPKDIRVRWNDPIVRWS